MLKRIASVLLTLIGLGLLVGANANAETWEYVYTGTIEEWEAPRDGQYSIEIYGASGGGNGREEISTGKGGYTYGTINLAQGTKLYIAVGENGELNGEATFNGGGAGGNETASGGGATSVTWKNRGELYNFEDYQDEVLMVAGGGGGRGSSTKYLNQAGNGGGLEGTAAGHYLYPETMASAGTQNSGYAFGKGEDYNKDYYHNGYGGAGGGGWYGGTHGGCDEVGGGGGSGYIDSKKFKTSSTVQGQSFDGSCTITYQGEAFSNLYIDPNGHGTYQGNSEEVTITNKYGTTINISEPISTDGHKFVKWEIVYGEYDSEIDDKYTFGFNDVRIRAIWAAPLTLTSKVNPAGYDNRGSIDLELTQTDTLDKQFVLYQSLDGENWYNVYVNSEGNKGEGVVTEFKYTGSVQEFQPTREGLYKLEVYGSGAYIFYADGIQIPGGYSSGYKNLTTEDILYIACGGANLEYAAWMGDMVGSMKGGWNGGGNGNYGFNLRGSYLEYPWGTGGGGATHIATSLIGDGQLKNYSNNRDDILIVAGGAGGNSGWGSAGVGGGLEGGAGATANGRALARATQTSGYAFGQGGSTNRVWSYGSRGCEGRSGGGGGWYGGPAYTGPDGTDTNCGGSGGSGYIGGVDSGVSLAGQNMNLGKARISLSVEYISGNFADNIGAPDINAPTIPENGLITVENGVDLVINWDVSTDIGTTYYHKAETYINGDMATPIRESNITEDTITSGLAGYYYYIDDNEEGLVTSEHIFVSGEELVTTLDDLGRYVHIASVDKAGNISETYDLYIPKQYYVHYDKNDTAVNINGNPASTVATGEMEDSVALVGVDIEIKENEYLKEGYHFKEWNTKSDGTGTVYNPGDIVNFDILQAISNTVYAIWEPNKYNVVIHGNGDWNNYGDVEISTEFDKPTLLPDNPYTREPDDNKVVDGYKITEPFEFIGWSNNPEATPSTGDKIYPNKGDITNIINGEDQTEYDLYALWKKDISITFNLNNGRRNGSPENVVISHTIYNSQLWIDVGLESDGTLSLDSYGEFNADGINTIYTRLDSAGTVERFLGWSSNKNDTVPFTGKDENIIQAKKYNLNVYDTNRSKSIRIYDSDELFAIFERVLYVNAEVHRTLGDIPYKDSTVSHALKVNGLASSQLTDAVILRTIVKPGEQGEYKIYLVNSNDDTVVQVKFDESVTDIYDNGDSNSPWHDSLNPVSDNPLEVDQKHGLNRAYIGKLNLIDNKWYTPNYFGTDKSYETSVGLDHYDFTITVAQPSFYWQFVHHRDEVINIRCLIDVTDLAEYNPDSPGHGPSGGDTTLDELRTRLKIRLLD